MKLVLILVSARGAHGLAGWQRVSGPGGRGRSPERGGHGSGRGEWRDNFAGTRVFVENLSYDTDWAGLKDHFLSSGFPVVYTSVSQTQDGASKGCGIVQFESSAAAEDAIREMTGSELDGRSLNVRKDAQESSRRQARGAGSGARAADSWRDRQWSRVAGTADGEAAVDEAAVARLLAERDAARQQRDFQKADELLDDLADLGVSLDDARRQRSWWGGGGGDGGGGRGGGRSGAARGRREWFKGAAEPRGGGPPEMLPGDWTCQDCGALVFARKRACFKCGAPRTGEEEGDYW